MQIFQPSLLGFGPSCCQKGSITTSCPFGSQNTCSTCFLHLCHFSSDTTKANLWDTFGALFLVLRATEVRGFGISGVCSAEMALVKVGDQIGEGHMRCPRCKKPP